MEGIELTKRQKELVNLVLEGKSNKDIGAKMKLKEGSVKWHLTKIFLLCRVKTRHELMALFIDKKLD